MLLNNLFMWINSQHVLHITTDNDYVDLKIEQILIKKDKKYQIL